MPVLGTMTLEEYIANCPHEPGYGFFFYAERIASYYLDAWSDNSRVSPPNGYGAVRYNTNHLGILSMNVPQTPGETYNMTLGRAQIAINNFTRDRSTLAHEDWCENSPNLPFKWTGRYLPANRSRILDHSTWYTCPHCAYVKAQEILRSRGQRESMANIYAGLPFMSVDSALLVGTNSLEIASEVPPDTTETIKDYAGEPGYTCGNCGRLGHNSRACENPAKNFLKIGVELEGRFNDLHTMQRRAGDLGATYSGDGSIRESPDSDARAYEFKTRPGSLRETIEQVVAMYPDETDYSCGMHIHMSFPPEVMALLQTKEFFAYFKDRWQAWGARMNLAPTSEFYKRLNGENDYCNPNTEVLTVMTRCDRYSQLNFSAFSSHKTLECRLLPMFRRSSLAVSAIQELVSIYETFLAAPEDYGFVWDDFISAGPPESAFKDLQAHSERLEIDVPVARSFENSFEMELSELAPPADGMVRIALPVNQPITVEALSGRLRARTAA